MADNKTLEDLRKQITDEVRNQEKSRNEIKTAQAQIRDLRTKHASLVEERKANEEAIRALQTEMFEDREIAKDSNVGEDMRSQARERMQESQIAITGYRREMSKQNRTIAQYRTGIQKNLGSRESSEGALAASRTEQRETQSRARVLEQADNLTPQALRSSLMKSQGTDVELEGLRAGAGIRKAGGSAGEAKNVQQATVEFQNLFVTIKELRKSLATMKDGTEEYTKTQEMLTTEQNKASDALSRIQKIQNDVERRNLSGGGGGMGSKVAAGAAGIAGFAGDAFDKLGGMASQRYVLEEQKKQAQFQLQNMGSQDLRNRTSDATSYLSTGGGAMFGAEMPFGRGGGVNAGIKALGSDYATTNEAAGQYGMAMRGIERFTKAGIDTAGETMTGEGINPLTGGIGAAAGSFTKNFGRAGLETGKELLMSPSFLGRSGVGGLAGSAQRGINGAFDATSDFGGGIAADFASKGGGDGDMMLRGSKRVSSGMAGMSTAGLKIMQRAGEANNINADLMDTEQQTAQAGRVRERLSMAYAPAMQRYMDMQGSQNAVGRSRVISRAEREAQSRTGEAFAQDGDLGERGFGVEAIGAQNAATASQFGRFGANGMNERVSKTAMMTESMGLGNAGQSAQAMGRALQGGVKDPEAMFQKAVKEGLQKGLQDSREFQGLLQAATSTSENTADFEGSLSGLLRFSGSGRAGDNQTSQAAFKGINEMMSGKTGGWEDMVKFDITNKAAKGVIGSAAGKDLDRDDRTSLQNLANFSPAELQNKALVSASLTPKALKAVESQEGGLDAYIEGLSRSIEAQGSTINAINSTQSEDLAAVKNMLDKGDKAGLKKMFAGPGGKERLQKIYSQILSGNKSKMSTDFSIGAAQGVMNQIGAATGIDTKGIGMQEKYTAKTVEGVTGESTAAMTPGEQARRGDAQMGQSDIKLAAGATRDANGNSIMAKDLSDQKARYDTDQQKRIDTIGKSQTVAPAAKVDRIDQEVDKIVQGLSEMKDALKNFSGKDFIVNAGKDIVIQGAASIKGVMLDNGLTRAASEAGKVIADTVKGAMGTNVSGPGTAPKQGSNKSNPTPLGQ